MPDTMKRLLLAFLCFAPLAVAEESFPGLQAIMTAEEFRQSGLYRLSPAQLQAVNAAIVRHYTGAVETAAQQQAEQIAVKMVEQKVEQIAQQKAEQIAQEKIAQHEQKSLLQRFGLPDLGLNQEWKDQPSLTGRVKGWVGGNSFRMDNGQVWEGVEPIPVELVNRQVEIAPRPNGQFVLIVEGRNTTVRVRRVR